MCSTPNGSISPKCLNLLNWVNDAKEAFGHNSSGLRGGSALVVKWLWILVRSAGHWQGQHHAGVGPVPPGPPFQTNRCVLCNQERLHAFKRSMVNGRSKKTNQLQIQKNQSTSKVKSLDHATKTPMSFTGTQSPALMIPVRKKKSHPSKQPQRCQCGTHCVCFGGKH